MGGRMHRGSCRGGSTYQQLSAFYSLCADMLILCRLGRRASLVPNDGFRRAEIDLFGSSDDE